MFKYRCWRAPVFPQSNTSADRHLYLNRFPWPNTSADGHPYLNGFPQSNTSDDGHPYLNRIPQSSMGADRHLYLSMGSCGQTHENLHLLWLFTNYFSQFHFRATERRHIQPNIKYWCGWWLDSNSAPTMENRGWSQRQIARLEKLKFYNFNNILRTSDPKFQAKIFPK